nr:hypothetical protein [Tanacetum cinerariifolium]
MCHLDTTHLHLPVAAVGSVDTVWIIPRRKMSCLCSCCAWYVRGKPRLPTWQSKEVVGVDMGLAGQRSLIESHEALIPPVDPEIRIYYLEQVQSSQQCHLFSLARGTFLTSSGNFFWQWELFTGSGNALCILFPTTAVTMDETLIHPGRPSFLKIVGLPTWQSKEVVGVDMGLSGQRYGKKSGKKGV